MNWLIELLNPIIGWIAKGIIAMLPWFQPIKLIKAEVYIDTFNLRSFLAKTGKVYDPELVGNIEFLLSYGKGGIQDEIKIIPLGQAKQLTDLVQFPRRCYLSDVQYIELVEDVPKSFKFRHPLPLKLTPTEGVNRALEELSEVLERGFFEIEWKTAIGKTKRYKPKREKSEL